MRYQRRISLHAIIICLLGALIFGCSGNDGASVLPPTASDWEIEAPQDVGSHSLWGIWEITYDLDKLTTSVIHVRNLEAHFDITNMLLPPECGNCFEVQINSFDPVSRILDLNVTLRNPTQITAHDVRGILYTDDAGHLLVNGNAWTALHDIPGGQDINPFKGFGKNNAWRKFGPGYEEAQNLRIYIPIPPAYPSIKYAIDVSWPGNCKEPYAMQSFHPDVIFDFAGSEALFGISVRDWELNVDSVYITIPDLMGEEPLSMEHGEMDYWTVNVTNTNGVAPGMYDGLIAAYSSDSGDLALYRKVLVQVSHTPVEVTEITPPWLNLSAGDVCTPGDGSAYLTASDGDILKLHIFDITNPVDPIWVNCVEYDPLSGGSGSIVEVVDGYAYISGYMFGLTVIDVDPPESAHVVAVPASTGGGKMAQDNGYLYIVEDSQKLSIWDIDPAESTNKVIEITLPGYSYYLDVDIEGNYAFVGAGEDLIVIDIQVPESAFITNSFQTSSGARDLIAEPGIVYASGNSKISIIDISDPADPFTINTFDTKNMSSFKDIEYADGYLTGFNISGLTIYDVSDPADVSEAVTVEMDVPIQGIDFSDGYIFAADSEAGLRVFDVNPPETASLVTTYWGVTNAYGAVTLHDGLIYLGENGLSIIDPYPVESTHFISKLQIPNSHIVDIAISGNYAYLCSDGGHEIQVVDISDPASPQVVHYLDTYTGSSPSITVNGDFAYYAGHNDGLVILDISDPESMYIYKTVYMDDVRDVAVSGDYAYISGGAGLVVVDISSPGDAHIVHTVEYQYSQSDHVEVSGNYAYVTNPNTGIVIIDILDPLSATMVHRIDLPGKPGHPFYAGDTLYIGSEVGVEVINIAEPENAFVEKTLLTSANGMFVDGDIMFTVESGSRAFKIFDLAG